MMLKRGWLLLTETGFAADIGRTVWRVLGGFVLGGFMLAALLALPLGALLGAYKPVEAVFEPFVSFARYLPASAFIPLLISGPGVDCGLLRAQQLVVADSILHQLGLRGFESHFPQQLFGGMQQRVAIARALVNGPRRLLMDEPFGALDHQTRELMQALLLGIWEAEQKTVLFVTHEIDEAGCIGRRVVVMSARPGRIKPDRAVTLPHPRHYSVKTRLAFVALKAELTEQVRVEVWAVQTAQTAMAAAATG